MLTPPRRYVRAAVCALAVSTLALAVLLGFTWVHVRRLSATVDSLERDLSRLRRGPAEAEADPAAPVSPLLLQYQLDLPGRGEVFPAMATANAPQYWPVATLQVTNTAERATAQTISAELPGWSLRSEQTLVLGPGETRQLRIQPELLPRAYANDEIHHALLEVKAAGPAGTVLFAQSRPVLIHGGSEIYWGRRFANAQVTARWVTPHDPAVLELVSEARRYVPRGRMAGYNVSGGGEVEPQVRAQASAIYRALQRSGLSYVNSLFVMGEHVNEAQRIRLPPETLRLASANCMDVSVVFASAVENLGMQPLVVILPGHAVAGVRLGHNSEKVLYLDLTVLPGGSFEAAVARAQRWLERTRPAELLAVDVAAARALGLYPLAERTTRQAALDSPPTLVRSDGRFPQRRRSRDAVAGYRAAATRSATASRVLADGEPARAGHPSAPHASGR